MKKLSSNNGGELVQTSRKYEEGDIKTLNKYMRQQDAEENDTKAETVFEERLLLHYAGSLGSK